MSGRMEVTEAAATLSFSLDETFLSAMADRFPRAAYSCLGGGQDRNRLLSPSEWVDKMEADHPGSDRESTVTAALSSQSGDRWAGIENEPPVRRAALLLLAAHAAGRDIAGELADLNRWALLPTTTDVEPDWSLTVELKTAAGPVVEAASARHGRSNTVAAEIMRRAKARSGVLPGAYFMWLRQRDRILWLLLCGHGRSEFMAETLGVVVHHDAEEFEGRPLVEVPMDAAVQAMLSAAAGP